MDLTIGLQSMKHLFSFPFHDPRWKNKLLIGAGLIFVGFFIPVISPGCRWLAIWPRWCGPGRTTKMPPGCPNGRIGTRCLWMGRGCFCQG